MIAAPARMPRCSAWSVAVSQACSAIITSIAVGRVRAHVALHEAQALQRAALGRAGCTARPGRRAARRRSTSALARRACGAGGRARRRSDSPCRRRSRRRASARRRRSGERRQRVVEDLDELVDLLPLARHRRHQPACRVGDAQVDEPGTADVDASGASTRSCGARRGAGGRCSAAARGLARSGRPRRASRRSASSCRPLRLSARSCRARASGVLQMRVRERAADRALRASPSAVLDAEIARHVARRRACRTNDRRARPAARQAHATRARPPLACERRRASLEPRRVTACAGDELLAARATLPSGGRTQQARGTRARA